MVNVREYAYNPVIPIPFFNASTCSNLVVGTNKELHIQFIVKELSPKTSCT